jgi:signal transduction histidine kinase
MTDPHGALRTLSFFKDLSDGELGKVAALCREERFAAGDAVFTEGDPADKLYIIREGTVEVWKDYAAAERDLLALHGSGHLFGEMALIDDLPRSATVIARGPVKALSIGRTDFHRIITENSSVALSVMRSVSALVRSSNESFVETLRRRNTELVRANRELKKTQAKLLRAERLSVMGRFSSLILHDIRNPISILRGFAELALLNPEDTATVKKNLSRILDEADRLNRIASELLDFSRGEISLTLSIVDLRDLVKKTVDTVADAFAARGIQSRVDVRFAGPVILDHDRMLRVLLNLADNSRKAMPRGGTFTVSVAREDSRLLIDVADTGEGMDEEVQKTLFEPFETHSKEGGTGLGTVIVKNIVEAHDGTLTFTSEKGKGTAFRISLPIRG